MFEHDKDSDVFPLGNQIPDQPVQPVVFVFGNFPGDGYGQQIALNLFNMLEHGVPWTDTPKIYLSQQ
jgi:hypothetical protein